MHEEVAGPDPMADANFRSVAPAWRVLDAGETIGDRSRWSYLLLADELRRRSHRSAEDLRELFGRMTFNALISDTDDHACNHGLIAPGAAILSSPRRTT
jgi:serine/threonine-protein kinase HipA